MENPGLAPSLLSYPRYRPKLKPAPFLPTSRAEMDALGWDECDIIVVTGDAYIDHPSFGMALIGRTLEAQGFRVGIISQPDWHSADAFRALGKPRLFFGLTAGNMDSMINRYTADRKPRSDDAYTADALPDKRPDRAVVVYAQRAREAYPDANIVIGSIEASLRRIAHYDHWSEKVRRSVLPDAKADLLIFGSGERATIALAHRLAAGEPIESIRDLRGTAFMVKPGWHPEGFVEIDSVAIDRPGPVEPHRDPYEMEPQQAAPALPDGAQPVRIVPAGERVAARKADRARQVIRLPAYEVVKDDKVMYAHASRTFHLESNPGNARAMVQAHGVGPGCRDVWLNPPPLPLSTEEMDWVFGQPYARKAHPVYG
nr:YgiQ family radical SAM protein [Zoogloea sp.]